MRLVKKILLYTLFALLGLFLLGTILVYVFEDDIKKYAVDRLNRNLNTRVQVDQIELSLWSNFPNATLEFTNVFIPDAYENRVSNDTFLVASYIGMEFDIIDLYRGNYEVQHINMRDGMLSVKVDETGDGNYNIWKSSEEQEEDEEFEFKLTEMTMENVHLRYQNFHNGQDYSFHSSDLILAGNFFESAFDLDIRSNMRIDEFRSKAIRIVKDRDAQLHLKLAVDTENNTYSISQGDLDIEELKFAVTGLIRDDSLNTYCDLAIDGNNISLADFFTSFAGDALSSFEEYESVGQLEFQSTVKGNIGPTESPLIVANFRIQNGSILQQSTDIRLEELNLEGSYTNEGRTGSEELHLKNLTTKFLDKPISGRMSLVDFGTPKIDMTAKGSIDLDAFRRFFEFGDLESAQGVAFFDTDISFTINNPQDPQLRNLDVHRSKGRVDFEDLTFKLAAYPYIYKNVSGSFFLRGEDAAVKDLTMTIGRSDIMLDGAFQNFLSHLLKGQKKLNVVANLEAPRLDLNDFILPETEEQTMDLASQESEVFAFPSTMNFNLDTEIGEFTYGAFRARRISGNIVLLDKRLTGKNIYMRTCGGRISGGFEIDGQQPNLFVSAFEGRILGLEVDQAMINFERFGQTMFTEDNLKGEITSTFEVGALLDGQLNFDMNSITAEADVIVKDGELIQLEAFRDITEYMREKKSVNMLFARHIDELERRLSHVKFSRMENKIFVKKRVITIPDMEIKSNVMDMDLAGTHTFDDEIDYSMSFKFRDLISQEEKYNEFGRIIDDGTGVRIFMRMTGTVDDPIISIDKEQRKVSLKENIKEEGETMKSLLKKEFNLYKNDSTVQEYEETPKEEVEFLIYDDEKEESYEDEQERWEAHKDSVKQAKRNKSKIGKFIKKLQEEKEKEKEEVKFEVEK